MEYDQENEKENAPRRSIPPLSIPQGTKIPERITEETAAKALSQIKTSPNARTIDQIATEGSILFCDDDRGICAANDTRRLLHFNYEEAQKKGELKFAPFVLKTLEKARMRLAGTDIKEKAAKLKKYEEAIGEIEENIARRGLRYLISQRENITCLSEDFSVALRKLFDIHGFNIKETIDGLVAWAKMMLSEEGIPLTEENLLEQYMKAFQDYRYEKEFDASEETGAVPEKQKSKKALQNLIYALENSYTAASAKEIETSLKVLEESLDIPLTFLEFDHMKCAGLRTAKKSISKESLILTLAAVNRLILYKNHIFVLRRILESTGSTP